MPVALVGIGTVQPSGLLASSGNIFTEDELAAVRELGGVGDVCLRFLASNGARLATPLEERVIGMDLEQLRRTPRTVGVAGGRRKLPAIRRAIEGGWINCLITDRFAAERLLELAPTAEPPTAVPAAIA